MAGQLPHARVVVEAASFKRQADLVRGLKESGRELILDTNVAELSSIGRYQGSVRDAPWANHEGVLTPAHLSGIHRANVPDVLSSIARFVIEHQIDRVHAPSHLLLGVKDEWFDTDLRAVDRLRSLLDREGGKDIAIDYPLLITNTILNDPAERKALLKALTGAPVQSLWLRVSGFGAEATPAGIRRYISALQDFHSLSLPIVADHVGGMAALAIMAFGAASSVAYGAAEKERFDATSWHKPKKESGGGGGGYTVLLPGIDRLLKREDAQKLIDASHGRRLLSCNDRSCCPGGFEDTVRDPRGHYLRQRSIQCEALSSVGDSVRPQHFLDKILTDAERKARQVAKLKVGSDKITEMLEKNATRLERLHSVLDDLNATGAISSQSKPLPGRTSGRDRNHGRN